MRRTLTGRIKREPYWSDIPGYIGKANCSFCEKKKFIDIIESETAYEVGLEHSG